jgi:L-glyceraldehyde reductase
MVMQAVNQIEAHPLLPQDDLISYCRQMGIHLTAYSPLGKSKLIEHPVIKRIARELDFTSAQVLLAWAINLGFSVIPKSIQEERIRSNFISVVLRKEDYEEISTLGIQNRTR